MFTHIMVGSNDVARSISFYDPTFAALGISNVMTSERGAFYRDVSAAAGAAFGVVIPADGAPARCANGGTIGFAAKDAGTVDAWHAAGLANGGSDEGPPGVRPNSPGQQYGAYLRDPDGNKICAFAPKPNAAA